MTRRILITLLLAMLTSALPAQTFNSVNIDKVTAAAMTAAYGSEAGAEAMTTANLQKILNHYKSASIATAGILMSKKKDRDAMRNPGLFATEENYYYKRILNIVKNGIMPKFITVASKMVKQPENAIYWGPYLYKMTTNVEQLCKEFELVATNGKRSFKDVTFLLISDDLKKVFDIAELGNVDWKELLTKLGDFGDGLTKEDIQEDFKNLGSMLAQIGHTTVSDALQETSNIGKIFHMKPKEIKDLYDNYKEKYDQYHDAGSVKDILMQVIQTSDADGVARLFKTSSYNLTGYISNYIKDLQGQCYTQRWYITSNDKGSATIAEYTPPYNPSWLEDPSSKNAGRDPGWAANGWLELMPSERDKVIHTYPTNEQTAQIKEQALSKTGWSSAKMESYGKDHPGHTVTANYVLQHKDVKDKYKTGWNYHYKNYCEYAYAVTITDTWDITQELYEDIFDSQTMDLSTFRKKMEAKLRYYQDLHADDGSGTTYQLVSDPPKYYTVTDEKKMEGCNSVSFLATCDGGASLAEGSFSWKENGKQGNNLEDPKSKDFAMRSTPKGEDQSGDLLAKKKEKEQQIADIQANITHNDQLQKDIIEQEKQAKLANNMTLVHELMDKYDSIAAETGILKEQLETANYELKQINNAIDEYYADLDDEFDGTYRIPANMTEMESMYQIQWTDEGSWTTGATVYIFVRHGYCPTIKSAVTYSATLKVSKMPKYLFGIRIHRAVLTVDFKLTSEFSSENVVEVMNLDMKKSEQQRAEEVNARLKELMEDMPDCSIRVNYNYASAPSEEDDEDAIHLLWASDRLDIAREVDRQLTDIYAQLIILEKVMTNRETILDFLKHKILDVVSRDGRSTIAEYALSRWKTASASAMSKQQPI